MYIDKVKILVSRILNIPLNSVKDLSSTNDHEEWDSLKQLQIVVELEQVFDITIPINEFGNLTSIPAIVKYLEKVK